MHRDLEYRSPSLSAKFEVIITHSNSITWKDLPACDNAVGKEEGPDSEPSVSVLVNNFVLVADPFFIPAVESSRVMDTQNINVLYFETSTLKLDNKE